MNPAPPPAPEPQKVEAAIDMDQARTAVDRMERLWRDSRDDDNRYDYAWAKSDAAHLLKPALDALEAARSSNVALAALAAKCGDLELIARLALSHIGTSWLTKTTSGFWLNLPPHGEHFGPLQDDGTGLPALSAPAREALRRAGK